MNKQVYWDEPSQAFLVNEVCCDGCQSPIKDLGVWVTLTYKHKPQEDKVLCQECSGKHSIGFAIFEQKRWVVVTSILPKTARLVLTGFRPVLRETELSCFDVGSLKSERTKDCTVYSGMPSLEGAQVGRSVLELEDGDRPINNVLEFKSLLAEHLESVPFKESLLLAKDDGLVDLKKKLLV